MSRSWQYIGSGSGGAGAVGAERRWPLLAFARSPASVAFGHFWAVGVAARARDNLIPRLLYWPLVLGLLLAGTLLTLER